MQYSAIFTAVKTINFLDEKLQFYFSFFAQNIDYGYKLERGSNASTHNLCLELKIRK